MIGFAGLLDAAALEPTQASHLQALHGAANQLMAIINDVLDLSRIEAGALPMENEAFDLEECIAGALEMMSSTAEAKELSLVMVAHGDCTRPVVGDPHRVRQVALNLISNAVKFTERGSVRVDLARREDAGGACWELQVRDTGIGMSAEVLARVFDPFRQGEESTVRRFGGSGLGLSICKRLVEMMGGGIEVRSTPDAGSCFRVTLRLPHADPAAEAAETTRRRCTAMPSASSCATMRWRTRCRTSCAHSAPNRCACMSASRRWRSAPTRPGCRRWSPAGMRCPHWRPPSTGRGIRRDARCRC